MSLDSMRMPDIIISDTCLRKIEQKHGVELEYAVQGVKNAKRWRKVSGRYEASSSTDAGRCIFVVVDRLTDRWEIVTAWWP